MKAVGVITLIVAAVAIATASPLTRLQQKRSLQPAAATQEVSSAEHAVLAVLEAHAEHTVENKRSSLSARAYSQHMAEMRANLVAVERLIQKMGGGGPAESAAALKAANRCGGKPAQMVVNSMHAAFTSWGMGGIVGKNWWIHSGTSSFFYNIRGAASSTEGGPVSDVDCHVHPLGAKHREIAGGNGLIHVDAYDPCVDKGQQWALDIESAVKDHGAFVECNAMLKPVANGPETPAPFKVVTLNQLYHEYATIVRKDAQGKVYDKPNDKFTREAAAKLGATDGANDYLIAK